MKRYLAPLFSVVLILTISIAMDTNAQAQSRAAAQAHIQAAKDLAYEPGNDLTDVYDTLCQPALS